MKKIFATLLLVGFVGSAFAGHFSIDVNFNAPEGSKHSIKYDMDVKKNTFSFSCQGNCDGTLQDNIRISTADTKGLLVGEPMNEFISETGQLFLVHEYILEYERKLLSSTEKTLKIATSETTDFLIIAIKNGRNYTIDIYTGDDAIQYLENAEN